MEAAELELLIGKLEATFTHVAEMRITLTELEGTLSNSLIILQGLKAEKTSQTSAMSTLTQLPADAINGIISLIKSLADKVGLKFDVDKPEEKIETDPGGESKQHAE